MGAGGKACRPVRLMRDFALDRHPGATVDRAARAEYARSLLDGKGTTMTLCPIALVAGCAKCPAVSVCPLKTIIGDAPKASANKPAEPKKK